ncbi:hypothetical protein QFC20_006529 [Naganishia adeliensis]|uniref:Uncharacterized protein n=1 Tax=Naganishia adeliensis TaxID=92952 RepID=A0ACC2VA24_9TREE|nr:hypothetical protein QFC20_006529 [Naganishia adeliensis]
MPPRIIRSTQAGSSSNPASSAPPVTPAPSPMPEAPSQRSQGTLTPAPSSPSTPVQRPSDRAAAEPESFRLPEVRVASADEVARLNEIAARLQRQMSDLHSSEPRRPERQATIEEERPSTFEPEHQANTEREPTYREASYAPTSYSCAPHKPKIKASDLPKFSGKDTEDVDQWIEKVSAIFEYSGVHDSDLLQQLPLVLQGNALTWFTQLGKGRHSLKAWHDWQLAIRNAFLHA